MINVVSLKILLRVSNWFESEIEGDFDKYCLAITTVAFASRSNLLDFRLVHTVIFSYVYRGTEYCEPTRIYSVYSPPAAPPTSHIPSRAAQQTTSESESFFTFFLFFRAGR